MEPITSGSVLRQRSELDWERASLATSRGGGGGGRWYESQKNSSCFRKSRLVVRLITRVHGKFLFVHMVARLIGDSSESTMVAETSHRKNDQICIFFLQQKIK